MAFDLDKLSSEMEDALERARLLAEQRHQATITPFHMIYVLLDNGTPLAAILEKAGTACAPLLDMLAERLNKAENTRALEPGKRPTASRSLRELIEKSFEKMNARGAEMAEPIDFLAAALEHTEQGLKQDFRQAGI